jgi:hypothetical protein
MQVWRKHILFYSAIAMMASLFASRTGLSISMMIFIAACFIQGRRKEQFKNFFSSPLLWSMSLLFFLPLLSGLWSEDKNEWMNIMRIKIPLLLFPLAFAASFGFSEKQWQALAFIFVVLVTAGTAWSMFHYLANIEEVNEGYLRAKSLVTPLANDHVRFSWMISAAIFFCVRLWWKWKNNKTLSWLLVWMGVWLIIFLHILAARTGLISFYIILTGAALWIIFKKAKTMYGTILVLLMVALPVASYLALPTFRNKVKFFNYDFGYFKDVHYLPGGNDATRVISLKAGWDLMSDHAFTGTGFGDIKSETNRWYDNNYPEMLLQDKILPSSEWLMYGSGCGIPGVFLFTLVMLIPLFMKTINRWQWILLNTITAFSFLFDIGLEVQMGVFLYSFVVLTMWKWLKPDIQSA